MLEEKEIIKNQMSCLVVYQFEPLSKMLATRVTTPDATHSRIDGELCWQVAEAARWGTSAHCTYMRLNRPGSLHRR